MPGFAGMGDFDTCARYIVLIISLNAIEINLLMYS